MCHLVRVTARTPPRVETSGLPCTGRTKMPCARDITVDTVRTRGAAPQRASFSTSWNRNQRAHFPPRFSMPDPSRAPRQDSAGGSIPATPHGARPDAGKTQGGTPPHDDHGDQHHVEQPAQPGRGTAPAPRLRLPPRLRIVDHSRRPCRRHPAGKRPHRPRLPHLRVAARSPGRPRLAGTGDVGRCAAGTSRRRPRRRPRPHPPLPPLPAVRPGRHPRLLDRSRPGGAPPGPGAAVRPVRYPRQRPPRLAVRAPGVPHLLRRRRLLRLPDLPPPHRPGRPLPPPGPPPPRGAPCRLVCACSPSAAARPIAGRTPPTS